MTTISEAGTEWRRYGIVPLVGALGYATSVMHIYGIGPFIAPLTAAFGWTRSQAVMGLTIATLLQAVFSIPVGLAVDRFGPRKLALIGIPAICATYALLGFTSGSTSQWAGLWFLMALSTLPIQATVWTSAVASRFVASRGMALAVTLCGASVAIAVFPVAGAWLIPLVGWRNTFFIQGAAWCLIAYLPIILFFRGAHDGGVSRSVQDRARVEGVSLGEGLRSSVYARLFLASLLFTFTILALVVHFVPILTDRGASPLRAASTASLIGIASIVGRLTTGLALDRFRASLVGAIVFLLPAAGCLILLAAGAGVAGQVATAILIGLTLGAEIDVIVYITTRQFGLRAFGGLYGGLLAALSIGTATGPLAAAAVFDHYGSYAPFLWGTLVIMLISSAALASLPRPPYLH